MKSTLLLQAVKLNRNSIPIILWNLFPVAGVLFLGWKPESIFICYALETIVVGIFNVFRMLAIHYNGMLPIDETDKAGLLLIPFFLFHFYIIVYVQLSFFFSGSDLNNVFVALSAILQERTYNLALGAFVFKNIYEFLNDFILNNLYKQRAMGYQMMEPYSRIFFQQPVVMLGGFMLMLTENGYPVLIIFVALKMFADLVPMNIKISKYTYGNMVQQKPNE